MNTDIDQIKYKNTGDEYKKLIIDDMRKEDSALNKYLSLDLLSALPGPPNNSDEMVFEELKFMREKMNAATKSQIEFAQNVHDLKSNYLLWSIFANKLTNSDYTVKYFNDIADQTDGLINYVKMQFARPRPYDLAEILNMPIELNVDKRYSTGSYPSGHACEAFMFARILAAKHPKHEYLFDRLAERVANSRIIAGVHFPTDIIGGKMLADQIINNNLCTYK